MPCLLAHGITTTSVGRIFVHCSLTAVIHCRDCIVFLVTAACRQQVLLDKARPVLPGAATPAPALPDHRCTSRRPYCLCMCTGINQCLPTSHPCRLAVCAAAAAAAGYTAWRRWCHAADCSFAATSRERCVPFSLPARRAAAKHKRVRTLCAACHHHQSVLCNS